jgi:hypothetical protein
MRGRIPDGAASADLPLGDAMWPRLATMRHGPFPCPAVSAPGGVFDDPRTLLHVAAGFDLSRPAVIVVFFHGWCATLSRRIGGHRYHVVESYRLIEQVDAAGLNAVVIAPQFARDADAGMVATPGHPGKLAQPGGFARFLDEATARLARRLGAGAARRLAEAPVVLMSFSGGYRAAARTLAVGGAGDRLIGFIGLDTIYGEVDAFAAWFAASHRRAFIAAVHTGGRAHEHAAAASTLDLRQALAAMRLPGVRLRRSLPRQLVPGIGAFVGVGDPALHLDLVASGWPGFDRPVRRLLQRLPGFARAAP